MLVDQNINSTLYRVLYGDVDQMGVIYYGNYFRLFELGRAEFIRERGMSCKDIEEAGFMLPVTEAHCHYYASARYDDLVLVETRVEQMRRASLRFAYDIFRDSSRREKLVDGWTVHACLNPEKKIVRLPDFMVELFDHQV